MAYGTGCSGTPTHPGGGSSGNFMIPKDWIGVADTLVQKGYAEELSGE